MLVKFKKSISLLQLIRIENELSDKTGIKIDLVTEGAIKNETIKKSIRSDLNVIYQARKRYKRYKTSVNRAYKWSETIREQFPSLFYHWQIGLCG